jgi:mannosylglycerate hydrolase
MMEKVLLKLKTTPDFVFLFDGQVVSIEDYLDVCPERRQEIEQFIKDGRLQIGPWYNLPDIYPVYGEMLIRNLLVGNRKANKLGKCFDIGYTTFGWGQTSQFPQILAGFGISRVVCAKNVSKERAPNSEFMWESPDGTRVFTTRLGVEKRANFFFTTVMPVTYGMQYGDDAMQVQWGEGGWLFHSADVSPDSEITFVPEKTYHPEMIKEAIEDAWKTTAESLISEHVFMGNGCDSTAPSEIVDSIISQANKIFGDKQLQYSDLGTYFDHIEKVIVQKNLQLKTVYGEMRDGPAHAVSGNALATRMPLKMLNRQAQIELVRYAEPFATLAMMTGVEYPKIFLEKAWQFLLLAHSHDALNGVTLDKTADDTANKLQQVIEISRVVTDTTAAELLKLADMSRFDKDDILLAVFNPTPKLARHICKAIIDIPTQTSCRRLAVVDVDGDEFSVQPIAHYSHHAPVCVENSRALPFYADRHSMYLDTGEIPGYGYKLLKIKPVEAYNKKLQYWHASYEFGSQITGPNKMENQFISVAINSDGTFNLYSKVTGRLFEKLGFFEDGGDVGDYWQRIKPNFDKVCLSMATSANISVKEDGPLVTTYVCELTMTVPSHAKKEKLFATARAETIAQIKITQELTLKTNSPHLEINITVINNAKDHRLRVVFPTGIEAGLSDAMGHFNVDSRQIKRPYEKGIRDAQMGTLPMQHFMDVCDENSGLAFINKNLTEYEVSEDSSRTVYLTLLRCINVSICTEGRCGTIETGAEGSQCLGKHTFNLAIMPHNGNWEKADIYGATEHFVFGPRLYQTSVHDNKKLSPQFSLLSLDNPAIQIAAIKKAQDSNDMVIRLYNSTASEQMCGIALSQSPKAAWLTDMNETKLQQLELPLRITIPHHKIVTLLVQM